MQPAGTLIEGKYEILAKIREGGMGTIYRVRHRLLDEVRAIKVIRPQGQADPELKRRFTEEAKTATRLKHPNVATIYDFAVDEDGTAYLVMEFIEGVNLADLLASQGALPVPLALEIAHQTLSALGYLHRKNVVHRDVAPDNLMLTRDEEERPRVKLIDLGIAKALDRPADMTSTGMFLGKLKYASPEQYGALASGEKLDGRSDLYGFGVVLYELLTGSRPFVAETPVELLKAHLSQPPLPFSESDPGGRVLPELRDAILKALEKKRENRFGSAEEFDQALAPLRHRFPLSGNLDPTLVIPSVPLAAPPSPAVPITPGVQDQLDRQFVKGTPPERAVSPIPEAAGAFRDVGTRRGCTVRVAVQFAAVIAMAAVAALLVVRSRSERPQTVVAGVAPTPVFTPLPQGAAPNEVVVAKMQTAVQTLAPTAGEPSPTQQSFTPTSEKPESPTEKPIQARTPALQENKSRMRAVAQAAQSRSADVRARAEAVGAQRLAAALYEGGRAQEEEAQRLMARGNFSGALAAFDLAARQYEKSESAARLAPRPPPTRWRQLPTPSVEQESAAKARVRCSNAQTRAEKAGAAELAARPYRAGRAAQQKAEDLMTRGDFAGAREVFDRSARNFEEAESTASNTSRFRPEAKLSSEQSRIRETIRLYDRAQNTLDVELYLRVFPSLDRRRVADAFSNLRSQSLHIEILSIDISPDGQKAAARVYERRAMVPKEGGVRRTQRELVLALEKTPERWVIRRVSRE